MNKAAASDKRALKKCPICPKLQSVNSLNLPQLHLQPPHTGVCSNLHPETPKPKGKTGTSSSAAAAAAAAQTTALKITITLNQYLSLNSLKLCNHHEGFTEKALV